MLKQALCFFSIVRYIADPIRNEPKNIGVIVVCPEMNFGGGRFLISRSGVAFGSSRYKLLQSLIQGYHIELPGYSQPSLFAPVPEQWTQVELEQLHRECTNLIQFTKPAVALSEPTQLLDDLYRDRVQFRESRRKTSFSRAVAFHAFQNKFSLYGKLDWVQEDAKIQINRDTYHFDLGLGNRQLYYAIKTLSFRNLDLQRVEEAGGWYALIWPRVAEKTGAKGLLLVEPPKGIGTTQDRFRRVTEWVSEAGIKVHDAKETNKLAEELVAELVQKTTHLHS